jgi:hypothetical protein
VFSFFGFFAFPNFLKKHSYLNFFLKKEKAQKSGFFYSYPFLEGVKKKLFLCTKAATCFCFVFVFALSLKEL